MMRYVNFKENITALFFGGVVSCDNFAVYYGNSFSGSEKL